MRGALGLALAFSTLLAAPAFCQEVLRLDEAIGTAQRNSLTVAVSEAKLAQAKSQISQTYAGLYPQVSLSSSAMSYRQIDSNAISSFGGGLGGMSSLGAMGTTGGAFNLVQNSVTVSQTLFDGLLTADALRIGDASVQMGTLERASQLRKTGYDVSNAFFQVLRTERLREVALGAVKQAQAHVESAQIRKRAGTGTQFEVLQAEAQLANVQGALRSATNNVDLSRLSLSNQLGEPLGNRALSQAFALPSVEFRMEDSLDPAIENRSELQNLRLKRRIDEANVSLNRKANYPKAQAQAQYSQQGLGTGRSLSLTAGLSWNLIDWGKADTKVLSSLQDLRQTELTIELMRRNLATDIQGALLARQDAHDRVAIAQKGLQVSQESFRMANVRYDAGVGTGYEVIDAMAMLIQSQNTYVQASYDLQLAEVRLSQALGLDLSQALAQKRS